MSSSSPIWDVELVLGPSRFCLGLSAALHGAALLALACSHLSSGLAPLLALGVVAAAWLAFRAERARDLRLRAVGEEWWLETGGRRAMVKLRRGRAWRWLVVMDLEGEWRGRRWRERIVAWPDAVSPDAFRRLRVRVRCAPRRAEEKALARRPPTPQATAASATAAPTATSAASSAVNVPVIAPVAAAVVAAPRVSARPPAAAAPARLRPRTPAPP